MKPTSFILAVLAAATMVTSARAELPAYQTKTGVSGNLNSVGSDTLNNLMTLWAESFRKHYPNVNTQIEGKGSSTAPVALIEGTAQLGPMSRAMKDSEIDAFEAKFGYKPTAIGVALDALAVFVNKDCPVESVTMEELDAVFSKTRKLGHSEDITTWGQLGATGSWGNKPISLYGRNSASGTYGYFKKVALGKGDYKDSVKEQPGSASVVNGITSDKAGIGYSGIGYMTSGVKILALDKGKGPVAGNAANVLNGTYPLGRMLYVYVAKKPGEPLPSAVTEFLTFVLSKEGQEIVAKDGYVPLTDALASKQLKSLQ